MLGPLWQEEIGEEQPGLLGSQPHERHRAWPRTKDYEDRPPRSRDTAAYPGRCSHGTTMPYYV